MNSIAANPPVTLRAPFRVCFNVLVLKQPFAILVCLLLTGVSPLLQAAEPLDKPPGGELRRKDERKKTPPEERKDGRKTNSAPSRAELEKRREQLKNMTPEERAAKRKEIQARLEKRIAELREKQKNGSITAQESRELGRREQILNRFEAENSGVLRPKPVLTNSPAKK